MLDASCFLLLHLLPCHSGTLAWCRDIKSSNVLLMAEGRAKIADVGLAKVATAYFSSANTIGTLTYAAPEMLLGHNCTQKVIPKSAADCCDLRCSCCSRHPMCCCTHASFWCAKPWCSTDRAPALIVVIPVE